MHEAISQGDKDFGDLIARMGDAGIGLVYFGGYHTEASLFVRQARAQGLKATMMVNSAMLTREYWDLAGPAAEGTLMTFGPDPRKLPSAAEVVARFEAEGHGAEARTLYSYATVQVFADAAGKAGSTDLERLERELHADTFQTVFGPITFDAKGDNARYEFRMYRWHDGRYEDICCGPAGGG
jgi:branched-chain amino acid transport system substrate-binding protein